MKFFAVLLSLFSFVSCLSPVQYAAYTREAAEEGSADAQFVYGAMCLGVPFYGKDHVPQDDMQGVEWLRKSVVQENVDAQCLLGQLHAQGRGVLEDDVQAVWLFGLAAGQGHALAQNNLGMMYDSGEGVPEDDREAVRWLRLAVDQEPGGPSPTDYFGIIAAQNNLGLMYLNGEGVLEDDNEAVRLLRLAADQGFVPAQFNLWLMNDNREGVQEGDEKALGWYSGTADLLDWFDAWEILYRVRLYDNKEALKRHRETAEQGNATAQNILGNMYLCGYGVDENHDEAVWWYSLAADQGLATAQWSLGHMYEVGIGVATEDEREALGWYRKAADQGDATRQFELGNWLFGPWYSIEEGEEPEIMDRKEAERWYLKAAVQGHAAAQDRLEDFYRYPTCSLDALGVPVTALTWPDYRSQLIAEDQQLIAEGQVSAYAWRSIAAGNGEAQAQDDLLSLALEMTPEHIQEAQEFSLKLLNQIEENKKVASWPGPTPSSFSPVQPLNPVPPSGLDQ